MAEVEACCADVDGQAVAVLARYMGWRAAKRVDAWWTTAVEADVPSSQPPIASSASFSGIVPSFAFSNDIVLEEALELAYMADGVLRLAEDRRWLERFVTILQYVLLRRVSLIEEAQLYRCLRERALFPCHPATHKRKGAVQGDRGTQRSTWAAAWRVHHRPTWLAPLSGGARFLCLPLSYFPVEAVLPYVACETWLSDRLLSTMLPRWERLCVRSLQRLQKLAPPVPTLKNGARAERMSSKVQYWFLRYTAPIMRTCVEQQRAAAHRFCMQELSTAAGYDNAASSDLPRGSLALLWRCLRSMCTCSASAASTSADSAVPNKDTSRLVRRVLILRAVSQAVTVTLQVCCPRLTVRYVTELMVAGYCAQRERSSSSPKLTTTTTDAAAASPVDTLLSSMAAEMGWALVAGVAEALLTRFTGITGHQLSLLLADAATRRVEQELLCVDEAFYCRWLRGVPGEADSVEATGVAASPGRRVPPVGMLPARPLVTADDVLATGRRGGERMFALHDAVVKRSLRYAALIARAAVTREWRPLVGAAVTAWVNVPALLSSFSVAVGYSTPSDLARLLSRREESLPSRSPVGLRLLLEVLVDEESDTTAPPDTQQRRRRRLRNPYLALVACSSVWTFEHLLADTKRSVANLCAHVCQLKAVYAAVAVYPYAVSSVRHDTTAADVIAAMQEDVRCVLYYSVYQMEHTCRKRCGGAVAASPLLHPLLDPEETALLQQPSALSYLPAHVDYFDLFSLPYRFVLRQLGLEMVFAYRTAAGMQQESQQMAEEWWAQALFNSTFNPLTSALHEVLQLTASCATVLLLCLQLVDGMWVVCPLPLSVLLRQAHAVQFYRDLLRSGVAVQRLEDGVAPLQQLCENLPHAVVSDAATLLRSSLQGKSPSAAPLSALQRRRRHWRQVLTASRPELCFAADDGIVGGLRLRGGVSWHHVYFTYPQLFVAPNAEDTEQESARDTCGVRPTIADACFACPAVGMTAVVGPSGAGKSSLNLLLRRLYDPVAVVELAHEGGIARSPPDEQLGAYVDLNRVGATADAEDVLVEVLRLALVESALPPPSNNVTPHSPSPLRAANGQRVTSQPSPTASAAPVTSPRYRLRVQPGYIALDGIPLSLFATAYVRQWLGWLRQTPHVQPRQSFLSNVRGTAMHVAVCDVQRALRVCGCDAFVEEKQRTLRDAVGHLSGGEAQRLALASVVAVLLARSRVETLNGMPLHDSDVGTAAAAAAVGGLVLDEPTSNLDAANENHLLAALEALQGGGGEADSEAGRGLPLFTWMISHRMSSLRSAQHMVVVEDGRVTASGPPAEVTEANLFAKTQLQLQQLTDVWASAGANAAS
ncbi:ABC transporter family-like protein [Leishmania major strain Friedlin]|uniref:ABC transporter family-like protein n=1 Tax=Leishmania major TaxID=5664 RepID=Q4Q3N2_LEIMA|nr:ABC transporter family-like protein [Leishmania major strain Friedlin]CAG9581005.1 ABC_transporter_family-like_protein/ABCI3 [Leishmania major strain Friedlin]CAJ06847.1 ABC transporter family-like protein [Leishmania major strain Friedlin]|eukprot:XP_001686066.1 ABC transporter family-like protein [Leishmania major strain Friedlin]